MHKPKKLDKVNNNQNPDKKAYKLDKANNKQKLDKKKYKANGHYNLNKISKTNSHPKSYKANKASKN